MKNKISIIFIIIISVVMIIVGIYLIKEYNFTNNDLKVKIYYEDISKPLKLPKKIKLSPEQENKIIEFYKNSNKNRLKNQVDLAIIGEIELKFSDGNEIYVDENNDNYAYFKNGGYIIEISQEFKDYLLNLIN